ncbi:hypothetical protein [Paracoccus sp. SSK6]|uniref:hypothetical protein n=1 Tax=Paracoccus sp. SSK6 TaxID=3143131 RepID=UPI0032199E94
MAAPFIALVSNTAEFDRATHERKDLAPFRMSISQREGEMAYLRMDMLQPAGGMASLAKKRILVSDRGRLIFDGIIQPSPRGVLSPTITVEAIARTHGGQIDTWLYELGESLKMAPYDALIVPSDSEDDIAEALAFRPQVIGHSRIQGKPEACDALGGKTHLTVIPLKDSLEFSQDAAVAKTYKVKLTAKWKQIGTQTFMAENIDGTETLSSEAFLEKWPQKETEIGTGFKVQHSVAEVVKDPMGYTYFPRIEEKPKSLDPAWAAVEKLWVASPHMHKLRLALQLRYDYEVARTETIELVMNTDLQEEAAGDEVEEEEIAVRDLTQKSGAKPFKQRHDYKEGDLIVEEGSVFRCREDHTSKLRRESSYWFEVGETNYLASRRMSSFFKSDRGKILIGSALARMSARAAIASRCVTARFTSAMPNPWLVTHDTRATINTPTLPGGFITGRLVEYELLWDRGRRTLSGTIAAVPGGGGTSKPSFGAVEGDTPSAYGRVEFAMKNALDDQLKAFNAGANIPITQFDIKTIPVANEEFEQEATVEVTGEFGLPKQVQLK